MDDVITISIAILSVRSLLTKCSKLNIYVFITTTGSKLTLNIPEGILRPIVRDVAMTRFTRYI